MKLVSYNVHYGVGRDGVYDLTRIVERIADADIIALQEVSRNLIRNGGTDMVARLAEMLPDHFQVFGAAMDIDVSAATPGARPSDSRRFQFGNMVLSRWPIATVRNLLLPRTRRLSSGNLQRAALEALIITPSGPLRVYSVHIDHLSHEERILQIRHLKERVYAFPSEGGAITGAAEYGFPEPPCPEEFVMMGDFNMIPGSRDYHAMTGEPDSQKGQHISWNQPVDAFALKPLPAAAATFVDEANPETSKVIDYVFLHAALSPRVVGVGIDADAEGSDHLPVWLQLS